MWWGISAVRGKKFNRRGRATIRNSKYLPKKPEENRKKRKTDLFSGQFFTLFWYISLHNFLKLPNKCCETPYLGEIASARGCQ
jgi:hypothetical protein